MSKAILALASAWVWLVLGGTRWEMNMTTDLKEDSKLHTPVSLTSTPYSRPRSDSTSVWAPGGDRGLSGNPGAAAVASWGAAGVEATTDGKP